MNILCLLLFKKYIYIEGICHQKILLESYLLFIAREKVLNNFKTILFPIKNLHKSPAREPTPEVGTEPTKQKKSKLKLQLKFMNEIKSDEKDKQQENE